MTLRETVQAELDRKGWTPYRLAIEAKVGQQVIHRWLTGKTHLRSDNLERVLDALGLEVRPKRGRRS